MKILNRIVVFVLGLSVFPVMFFRSIAGIVVSVAENSSLYTILSKFMEDTVNSHLVIDITLKEAAAKLRDGDASVFGMDFDLGKLPQELFVTKNWLIAAGVLLAVSLLIALVIMGCALFTEAYKTIICLSTGGAACVFASMKCFSVFAAPFVSGSFDLGKIIGNLIIGDDAGLLGSLGTSFLSGSVSVDSLTTGSAVITSAIIFIGIALWSIAYYITMPKKDDKKTYGKNHRKKGC